MSDPMGPWKPHPEKQAVIDLHAEALWLLLPELGARWKNDKIARRELKRFLNESVWAATETVVRRKYDVQFASKGVYDLCKLHGPLDSWAYLPKMKRPMGSDVQHEHVDEKAKVFEKLVEAGKREDVAAILKGLRACVVTKIEHDKLSGVKGQSGWGRYRVAGVDVWDRLVGDWMKL